MGGARVVEVITTSEAKEQSVSWVKQGNGDKYENKTVKLVPIMGSVINTMIKLR